MLNKVILIGHLGRDPEVKDGIGGLKSVRLSVATTRRVKRDGTWEDETEWHRVTVFSKAADFCEKYLCKGRQVYVEGRLQTGRWTDRQGIERQATWIVAQEVRALGQREDFERTPRAVEGNPSSTTDEILGGYTDVPF